MRGPPSAAGTLKLVGGDPGLDFVNTVGGRVRAPGAFRPRVRADKLARYSDLVAFAVHAGLLDEPTARRLHAAARARPRAAAAALARARAFREALYGALQALRAGRPPARADLRVVNAEIAAARGQEELAPRRGGLAWRWRAAPRRLESPLWPIARAAGALLPSAERARLRECGGEDCGWLFLDRSRNRRRRWCTMEDCGNRAKIRRFRRRQGTAGSGRRRRAPPVTTA